MEKCSSCLYPLLVLSMRLYDCVASITLGRFNPLISCCFQWKAVDLDSGSNAEVKYYINGTIKRKLSMGFENLRLDPFILNRRNGEISLNFDPRKDMKGYFEFDILANDSAGFYDTSRVFIYLLREDQRVRFVLRLTPQELREKLDNFRDVLSNITGAIVNVDSYKYHETFDGNVDKRRTDLYLHFVNPKDNSIMEVNNVLTVIDKNSEYLDELYKDFNVLLSEVSNLFLFILLFAETLLVRPHHHHCHHHLPVVVLSDKTLLRTRRNHSRRDKQETPYSLL